MRIKRGVTTHARHKKILKANKGYRMTKRRLYRVAMEAYLHAGEYAFAGRKNRKRDFRRVWITRISNAVSMYGTSYSRFIKSLKDNKIELNRKMLSYLATEAPEAFGAVAEKAGFSKTSK